MNKIKILLGILIYSLLLNCSGNKLEEKGFSVRQSTETQEEPAADGIANDSIKFETKPSNVLLTGIPDYRITTVYKVNYNKKTSFIGSNNYYENYSEEGNNARNQWHYNFMPGFEAVYGYNMVNISHYTISSQTRRDFFDAPVLIKTLYYPAFSSDTLNNKPVLRNYFMLSVYDEDTNKDGFINIKDLRRFYYFDIKGQIKKLLIPENYSVQSSEYDSANDFMYVFAALDKNKNGKTDDNEEIHIFWIDLKNPHYTGRQY